MCFLDGQKIAEKVSSQISKETKLISRSMVEDYNACSIEGDSQPAIMAEEVLNPITFEDKLQVLGVWCQGTEPEKREMMDSYLKLCRSIEELCMLTEEVKNMVIFYEQKKRKSIEKSIAVVSSGEDSVYNRGISSLLHILLEYSSSLLHQA